MTGKRRRSARSLPLLVTTQDVDTLLRIANYYLSLRPIRRVVVMVAPRDIRSRYRFVREESRWLERFARTTRQAMRDAEQSQRTVEFTLPAVVAFWGRLLASLNTPRSRRKLSAAEIERREELSAKLRTELLALLPRDRTQIVAELGTRRPVEEGWMRESLGLTAPPPTEQNEAGGP
ncbi:MAG TPA: hypothetical protein VKX16_13165 [Chloroflexota bacterium]|nr:hypothetical protein [Chloroflexota bacterium]